MRTLYAGTIPVEVTRKRVRNFNLRVRADGTAVLSMPQRATLAAAQDMLDRHTRWLEERMCRCEDVRTAPHALERGWFALWGKKRPLLLVEEAGRKRTRLMEDERGFVLMVGAGHTSDELREQCDHALAGLYRAVVRAAAPALITRYEEILGVAVAGWSVRSMRTRWGSCTPAKATIRLSAQLAAYPPACLEYVVAHELAHVLERNHTPRFYDIVRTAMPGADAARARLRQPPAVDEQPKRSPYSAYWEQ